MVGRMLAGSGLLGLCYFVGSLFGAASMVFNEPRWLSSDEQLRAQIQEMLHGPPDLNPGPDPTLLFIIWLIAAGASMIIFWRDWDRKWRVLHWLLFVQVMAWTMMWDGKLWFQFTALAGQFGMQWLVHMALVERDRREEREQEAAAAERRKARTLERRLRETYRGNPQFSEATGAEENR